VGAGIWLFLVPSFHIFCFGSVCWIKPTSRRPSTFQSTINSSIVSLQSLMNHKLQSLWLNLTITTSIHDHTPRQCTELLIYYGIILTSQTRSILHSSNSPILRLIGLHQANMGALQRGPGGPWPTQNFGWVGHNVFGPTNNLPVCSLVKLV